MRVSQGFLTKEIPEWRICGHQTLLQSSRKSATWRVAPLVVSPGSVIVLLLLPLRRSGNWVSSQQTLKPEKLVFVLSVTYQTQ